MSNVLGFFLALIVPLLSLGIIYKSDFYQTGQFPVILKCLFWGGVAFAPATFIYITVKFIWPQYPDTTIVRFLAPIYEEALKALILLYLFRQVKFTYSVDGALYGFAIGTGFAIIENFSYILYGDLSEVTLVAAQRIFSANLVHAFSTAAVGMTLGLFRSRKFRFRWQVPIIGLTLAIVQHMLYNNMIYMINTSDNRIPPGVIFIPGLLGIFFIIYIMQRGKKQAQAWIKEKLGMEKRVTRSEIAAVDRLADTDVMLLPIVERFGAEKAEQVEKLLYLQARIGIKRKALDGFRENDTARKELESRINKMRADMKKIQREIGIYVMLFVRGLFTEEMVSVWERLQAKIRERTAASGGQKGGGLWASLEERVKSQKVIEESD